MIAFVRSRSLRARAIVPLVLTLALVAATAGCTNVRKQGGVFEARGVGIMLFTFSLPRTDYETVSDAITREIGEDARITDVRRTTFLRPFYNILYPILGVETVEVYGTY